MTTEVLEAQRLADRDADKMVLADKIGLAVPRPSGEANLTDERAGSSSLSTVIQLSPTAVIEKSPTPW